MWLFTALFGVLVYWLLGFLINDISHWPPPDYQALEERLLDPALTAEAERLDTRIADVQREIDARESRQRILRDSTNNAQQTMNQLLEFQRLSLEKNVTPTEEEQLALAESQKLFLANQSQYQQITEQISVLQEDMRTLHDAQRLNEEQSETARKPILDQYESLLRRHNLTLAAVKLAVLVPLLIAGIVVFLKRRESIYVPLFAAFAIAVAVMAMFVMHEYFPARYFKYVLIATFLAVVTKAVVRLIRMIAFPKAAWLQEQFREAYEAFLCPICKYPIRRGPLKYLFWTRRTIKKLHIPDATGAEHDEPYNCPSCGTRLFEECSACHAIRHSLLPACEHCGAEQPVGAAAAGAAASEETSATK
jgi:predicted RNA-binding Zn-ribbon protein involved in translation (DUF1610 family)